MADPLEPIGYHYELAHAIHHVAGEIEYHDWREKFSKFKPVVPEGSIRNLRTAFVVATGETEADVIERSLQKVLAKESAIDLQRVDLTQTQSDMSAAPPSPLLFLAENSQGDWLVVQRYDPYQRGYTENFVINGRTGLWWNPRRWRPLDTASPALGRDA